METKARARRTNAKPEGFRVVDLPHYEVLVDGVVVGQVYAWLSRGRKVGDGKSKVWSYRIGPKRHASSQGYYTNKRDAQRNLIETLEAQNA